MRTGGAAPRLKTTYRKARAFARRSAVGPLEIEDATPEMAPDSRNAQFDDRQSRAILDGSAVVARLA